MRNPIDTTTNYRAGVDGGYDAVLVGDVSGIVTKVNAAACGLTGYRPSELVGMNVLDLVAPEWAEFAVRQWGRDVKTPHELTQYECTFLTKGGSRVPVRVTSTPVREQGKITGLKAVVQDASKDSAVQADFTRARTGSATCSMAPRSGWQWWFPKAACSESTVPSAGYSATPRRNFSTSRSTTSPIPMTSRETSNGSRTSSPAASTGTTWRSATSAKTGGSSGSSRRHARAWSRRRTRLLRPPDQRHHGREASGRSPGGCLAGLPGGQCRLSPRETDVLRLLAAGQRTSEAAATLGVSDDTVQTLVKRAMRKLGARNRTHLVAKAIQLGSLDPISSAADPPETIAARNGMST